jgi:hypothetical protein
VEGTHVRHYCRRPYQDGRHAYRRRHPIWLFARDLKRAASVAMAAAIGSLGTDSTRCSSRMLHELRIRSPSHARSMSRVWESGFGGDREVNRRGQDVPMTFKEYNVAELSGSRPQSIQRSCTTEPHPAGRSRRCGNIRDAAAELERWSGILRAGRAGSDAPQRTLHPNYRIRIQRIVLRLSHASAKAVAPFRGNRLGLSRIAPIFSDPFPPVFGQSCCRVGQQEYPAR